MSQHQRGPSGWRRQHLEALAGRATPAVHTCTAARRDDGRFDILIRGSGFGATEPIVVTVGRQPAVAMRAVGPGELRAVVDDCRTGEEFLLDPGRGGPVRGVVSEVDRGVRHRPRRRGLWERIRPGR